MRELTPRAVFAPRPGSCSRRSSPRRSSLPIVHDRGTSHARLAGHRGVGLPRPPPAPALAERPMPGVEVVALGRRLPASGRRGLRRADLDDAPACVACWPRPSPLSSSTRPAGPRRPIPDPLSRQHAGDAPPPGRAPCPPKAGAGRPRRLGRRARPGARRGPAGRRRPSVRPGDAYGLSKWLATTAGLAARPRRWRSWSPASSTRSARACRGPRRSAGSPPASRSRTRPPRLTVGDLDARRDFIDVRDVALALIALAPLGHAGPGLSRRHGPIASRGRRARHADREERPRRADRGRSARLPGRRARRLAGRSAGSSSTPAGVRKIGWEQSLADLWDEAKGRPRLPLTVSPAARIIAARGRRIVPRRRVHGGSRWLAAGSSSRSCCCDGTARARHGADGPPRAGRPEVHPVRPPVPDEALDRRRPGGDQHPLYPSLVAIANRSSLRSGSAPTRGGSRPSRSPRSPRSRCWSRCSA